jgi:glycosyltransferase involved in cell wall biosynthesis
LLIVARLHPEKGHRYLFDALPEIRRRVSKPVRLLVAGAGPFEADYREQVRAISCDDMVTFLGFRKDSHFIAAADPMVLPSVAEAFGLVHGSVLPGTGCCNARRRDSRSSTTAWTECWCRQPTVLLRAIIDLLERLNRRAAMRSGVTRCCRSVLRIWCDLTNRSTTRS